MTRAGVNTVPWLMGANFGEEWVNENGVVNKQAAHDRTGPGEDPTSRGGRGLKDWEAINVSAYYLSCEH